MDHRERGRLPGRANPRHVDGNDGSESATVHKDDLYFRRLWEDFTSFISEPNDQRTDLFVTRLRRLMEEFEESGS